VSARRSHPARFVSASPVDSGMTKLAARLVTRALFRRLRPALERLRASDVTAPAIIATDANTVRRIIHAWSVMSVLDVADLVDQKRSKQLQGHGHHDHTDADRVVEKDIEVMRAAKQHQPAECDGQRGQDQAGQPAVRTHDPQLAFDLESLANHVAEV